MGNLRARRRVYALPEHGKFSHTNRDRVREAGELKASNRSEKAVKRASDDAPRGLIKHKHSRESVAM